MSSITSSSCLHPVLSAAVIFLASAVLAQTPTAGRSIPTAAIYFPGYHRDPHYDAWFGEGFNEWQLLKDAKPLFPGHRHMHPREDWGSFDEADPRWMEKQIDLAADHAIDVFIFDWYWYSGVKILHRPLEEGFLHANNRNRLKYALMWANHTWQYYFPVPYKKPPQILLPIRHSAEDFDHLMQHCIATHFNQPNYWRVNDGLYFSIFNSEDFLRQLGGPEKTKAVLDAARKKIATAGLGRIHFAAFTGNPGAIPDLKSAGFDSTTSYNVTSISPPPGGPRNYIEQYDALMQRSEKLWKDLDTGQLPYTPVVTVGWDCTPRWEKITPWPPEIGDYPYMPVVVNNTPQKFGQLLARARNHVQSAKLPPPAILINAWNEWTEGSVLLPEERYGTGFLDQVKEGKSNK